MIIRVQTDDGVDETIECHAATVFAVQDDGTTMVGFGAGRVLHGLLLMLATGYFTQPVLETMAAMEQKIGPKVRKERKGK